MEKKAKVSGQFMNVVLEEGKGMGTPQSVAGEIGPPPQEAPLYEESQPYGNAMAYPSNVSQYKNSFAAGARSLIVGKLMEVNKELWLILSLLVLAGIMNYLVTAQRMVLGFYTLPTLFSAYFYGRRHATLTAFASVFLVGLMTHYNASLFAMAPTTALFLESSTNNQTSA